MGQAVVEQAAREKKTAVTDDGKREKASKEMQREGKDIELSSES